MPLPIDSNGSVTNQNLLLNPNPEVDLFPNPYTSRVTRFSDIDLDALCLMMIQALRCMMLMWFHCANFTSSSESQCNLKECGRWVQFLQKNVQDWKELCWDQQALLEDSGSVYFGWDRQQNRRISQSEIRSRRPEARKRWCCNTDVARRDRLPLRQLFVQTVGYYLRYRLHHHDVRKWITKVC